MERGTTLLGALQLINQDRVAAIISESNSRNTVTMAVAAAVSNVLHCSNLATTPQLSNKADYPTTFRTQSTALLQARSILATVRAYNKTTIGIFASSDEFGNGMVQTLQLNANEYNISISLVTVYDIAKADLREDLQTMIDGRVQTIVIIAAQFPVVNLFVAANSLNMLNGDYWFISTTGWTDGMFSTSAGQAILANMTGVWQAQTPLYEDVVLLPDRSNQEAVALRSFWEGLFVPNEDPNYPGVTRTFKTSYLTPFSPATAGLMQPSNCPTTDPQLNITTQIPNFIFQQRVGNQTVTLQAAGNMCTGPGNRYIESYLSIFSLNTKYMVKPTDYMHNTIKCAKAFIGMFDTYIKQGKITTEGINNRQLLSLTNNNITRLVNEANVTDLYGNPFILDNSGDLQMDQDIWVYKYVNVSSRRRIVSGVPVGRWTRFGNTIFINQSSVLFAGGKLAPPPTPEIPIIRFSAKMPMRYAFVALVAICSLFTLGLLAYMVINIQVKIFKASSPVFLALIILGSNISFAGVWIFSQYPMSSETCVLFGWFKYIGFAVVFGALLVKTYRIMVIFASKKNKVRKLSDGLMLIYFVIFVAIWVAILAIWTILPSQRPYLEINSIAQVARNGTVTAIFQTPSCNFNDYNYVCLGSMATTLAFGVCAFNESKWIAMAIYNWVVIGIVLNAIANFAVKDPDVIFVMEALVVIITQTGVAAVLFVPKAIEILQGRGDKTDTFQTSSNNSNNPDKVGTTSNLANPQIKSTATHRASVSHAEDVQKLKEPLLHASHANLNNKYEAEIASMRAHIANLERQLAAATGAKHP
ncbi:hypothetical protein HDU96_010359 [Phlyctochytrium bullatum]|nr:hypothetical protein HDU96_010359 [Phlyctochytrium bullatum]